MPVISQAISELQTHIYKPVMDQVAHHILTRLGYADIIGKEIYINTDFSTHSHTTTEEKTPVLEQSAFRVEANIRANPSSQKWDCYTFNHTAAYGIGQKQLNDSYLVYVDAKNSVRMKEFRAPVTIELNCELSLVTADLAYTVPQEIFNAYENGAIIEYIDLVYDYPVPKAIVNELHAIWRLDRLDGEVSGISFSDYVAKHCANDVAWNVRRTDGGHYEMIIPNFNLQALFSLEYSDDKPQANKQDRMASSYTISFVATVQFGIPTIASLQFPVVLTNRLLPKQLIPVNKFSRQNRLPERKISYEMDNYYKAYGRLKTTGVAQTPFYDEWFIPSGSPACALAREPFVIMHLLVDENECLDTIIDLTEFQDAAFDIPPVVKEILYQQGEDSMDERALYKVCLFKDDKTLIPYKDFTFNENLQLKFRAMNLNVHYRMALMAPLNLITIDYRWMGLVLKYFKYMSPCIKMQVLQQFFEGGIFYDRDLGADHIDTDGNIYDKDNNIISTVPEYSDKDIIKDLINSGGKNGYYSDSRITKYTLITHHT